MTYGKSLTFDKKWLLYALLAISLGLFDALIFLKLPLNYYLLLFGGMLAVLLIYHRIEWGIGLLIASMLFERPILPEVSELSLTRILSIPIIGVCAIKIFLDRKNFVFQKAKDTLVLILFCWMVISLFYARDLAAATENLLTFAQVIVLYFVLKTVIENEQQLESVLRITVIAGIGIAIFTIVSMLQENSSLIYSSQLSLSERISGSSDDPNKFAMALIFVLPIAFYLFVVKRKWYLFAVFLFTILILGTFSRGGYVALAAVLAFSAIQFIKFHPRKGWIYTISMVLVVTGSFLIFNRGNKVVERIETVEHYSQGSAKTRLELMEVAVDMGAHNPIFGVGLNNFRANSQFYGNQQHYQRDAHNGYLEVFATLGFPGFVMLIGLIYLSFKGISDFERNLSKRDKEKKYFLMARFVKIAFVGYLIAALFLSLLPQKLFWTLLAFSSILAICAEEGREYPEVHSNEANEEDWVVGSRGDAKVKGIGYRV